MICKRISKDEILFFCWTKDWKDSFKLHFNIFYRSNIVTSSRYLARLRFNYNEKYEECNVRRSNRHKRMISAVNINKCRWLLFVFFVRPRSLESSRKRKIKETWKRMRKEIRAARMIKRTFYRQIRYLKVKCVTSKLNPYNEGYRWSGLCTNQNAMVEWFAIREVVKHTGWGARTREPY